MENLKTQLAVPCEIYSRVVGYMRPIQQWNKGKQAEYRDRKAYNVQNFLKSQGENNGR